jgi:hypothetical protein
VAEAVGARAVVLPARAVALPVVHPRVARSALQVRVRLALAESETRRASSGHDTGLANRSANLPQPNPADRDQRNMANPQRGTNSVGTANSSGVGGSGRSSGPTRTKEGASDPQIDAENRKADQKVKSICKGC